MTATETQRHVLLRVVWEKNTCNHTEKHPSDFNVPLLHPHITKHRPLKTKQFQVYLFLPGNIKRGTFVLDIFYTRYYSEEYLPCEGYMLGIRRIRNIKQGGGNLGLNPWSATKKLS